MRHQKGYCPIVVNKGELISQWLFGVLHFQKKTQKFDEFLPKNLKSGQIIK